MTHPRRGTVAAARSPWPRPHRTPPRPDHSPPRRRSWRFSCVARAAYCATVTRPSATLLEAPPRRRAREVRVIAREHDGREHAVASIHLGVEKLEFGLRLVLRVERK